ncbi:Carboxylesterase 2 [Paraconexibacter sp. AEG42_29]|uniref:Carboxylesterase 2 n=1 Tax=Paraconexibacter sp. AEG42_29 TaxID=2997339 RepID=A0AAU7ATC6_9ACTN
MSALVHRIREPRNSDPAHPAGTLVLLHGRGADENDLFGLFDVLDPAGRLRGVTVGGPLTDIPPGGRHWYIVPRVGFPEPRTFAASYAALGSLLDDELGLDWSRTVVGGFSQGTVMSYSLGLGAGRPAPAGVLAFSGFIPTVDGWTPDLGTRPGLPVFLAHGTNDPIMGPQFARDARELLTAGGADVEYHETAAAHHIDPRVIPEAQRWLAQTLAPAPVA